MNADHLARRLPGLDLDAGLERAAVRVRELAGRLELAPGPAFLCVRDPVCSPRPAASEACVHLVRTRCAQCAHKVPLQYKTVQDSTKNKKTGASKCG